MRTSRLLLLFGFVALAACARESGDDQVDLRNEFMLFGHVLSYESNMLHFESMGEAQPIPRVMIDSIYFNSNWTEPEFEVVPEAPADQDRVYLRDGNVIPTFLEAIDTDTVFTAAGQFPRLDVFRIQFAIR